MNSLTFTSRCRSLSPLENVSISSAGFPAVPDVFAPAVPSSHSEETDRISESPAGGIKGSSRLLVYKIHKRIVTSAPPLLAMRVTGARRFHQPSDNHASRNAHTPMSRFQSPGIQFERHVEMRAHRSFTLRHLPLSFRTGGSMLNSRVRKQSSSLSLCCKANVATTKTNDALRNHSAQCAHHKASITSTLIRHSCDRIRTPCRYALRWHLLEA